MKLADSIKPISYLKVHASEIIRDVTDNRKTLVITQNGVAKVIVQDIRVYEQTQESLALLKILAKSSGNLKKGRIKPLHDSFNDLEKRISVFRENEV